MLPQLGFQEGVSFISWLSRWQCFCLTGYMDMCLLYKRSLDSDRSSTSVTSSGDSFLRASPFGAPNSKLEVNSSFYLFGEAVKSPTNSTRFHKCRPSPKKGGITYASIPTIDIYLVGLKGFMGHAPFPPKTRGFFRGFSRQTFVCSSFEGGLLQMGFCEGVTVVTLICG